MEEVPTLPSANTFKLLFFPPETVDVPEDTGELGRRKFTCPSSSKQADGLLTFSQTSARLMETSAQPMETSAQLMETSEKTSEFVSRTEEFTSECLDFSRHRSDLRPVKILQNTFSQQKTIFSVLFSPLTRIYEAVQEKLMLERQRRTPPLAIMSRLAPNLRMTSRF